MYDYENGNDSPYPLFLPTMTATAWYHKRLADDLQQDLNKTLDTVKEFALTEYATALMKGDKLSQEERSKISRKLAVFTGLSPEFIENANLRINPYKFSVELLRSKKLAVGRFDSRVTGDLLDPTCTVSLL